MARPSKEYAIRLDRLSIRVFYWLYNLHNLEWKDFWKILESFPLEKNIVIKIKIMHKNESLGIGLNIKYQCVCNQSY